MTSIIYKYGWDGEWFLRAYDSTGAQSGLGGVRRGKHLH